MIILSINTREQYKYHLNINLSQNKFVGKKI